MALAARKTQESGPVDRQPKIDGDENMMRVHKSINTDDALTATEWLKVTTNNSDCSKTPANTFSVKRSNGS
ncbi:MAG: hypothetical protein ABSA79_02755 [Candidatus Bathyarchaeia archaeon]|jgi:hypothetical protein